MEIDHKNGILIFNDIQLNKSTIEKLPEATADMIDSIMQMLLWVKGNSCIPIDFRLYQKGARKKIRNQNFEILLDQAKKMGFKPDLVCLDLSYTLLKNLKKVVSLGWHFLAELNPSRMIRLLDAPFSPLSELSIPPGGEVGYLKGYGWVKVFKSSSAEAEKKNSYYVTSLLEINHPVFTVLNDFIDPSS